MAPVKKRSSIRARVARSTAPMPATDSGPSTLPNPPALKRKRAETNFDTGFVPSKREKRKLRHNTILAKVQDSGIRKVKRRRRAKELTTDISCLADALPELEDGGRAGSEEWGGFDGGEATGGDGAAVMRRRKRKGGEGRMVMKSVKTRPGAMKRKQKMERMETERFRRNMAQLAGPSQDAGSAPPRAEAGGGGGGAGAVVLEEPKKGVSKHAERWAALRGFIGGTLEQSRMFQTMAKA